MGNVTGAAKLAATLQNRMNMVNKHGSTLYLELGKITSSMGLKLDNLSVEIPSGDYLVCRSLRMGTVSTSTNEEHSHSVNVGSANSLYPGCRVLVGWASGNPIVIDVVGS